MSLKVIDLRGDSITESNEEQIIASKEAVFSRRKALSKSQEASSIIEGALPETPKRPPKK